MISREICQRVLQKAVSTGADYAEIFAEHTVNHSISSASPTAFCATSLSSMTRRSLQRRPLLPPSPRLPQRLRLLKQPTLNNQKTEDFGNGKLQPE